MRHLQLMGERTPSAGFPNPGGEADVDKNTVDHDHHSGSESAAHTAEELMEQAAYTPESEGRLWRLEWAQAFRKLAEIGKREPD